MRHVARGWWTGALLAGAMGCGSAAWAQSMVDLTAAMGTQSAATATGGMSPVQTLGTVRRNLNAANAAHQGAWAEGGDGGMHGGGGKDAWSHGRSAASPRKGWATCASQGRARTGASTWARAGDTTIRRR
jgi:hypothetical protein